MKLRHKKPLNSYKGQANNDKNQFNDDDFRQQASPHKKVKERLKQMGNSNSDQIFKYARILAKFVKTINQDYRTHEGRPPQPHSISEPEEHQPREKMDVQPPLEILPPSRKEELKQQKQMSKLQSKIQLKQEQKGPKISQKKKETHPTPQINKETKPPHPQNGGQGAFTSTVPPTPSKPKNQIKVKEVTKPPPKVVDLEKPQNEQPTPGKGPTVKNPPPFSATNVSNTPLFGLNMNQPMNMGNYGGTPQNIQGMVNGNPMMAGMNNGGNMPNMGNLPNMPNLPMMNFGSNINQMELAQLLMRSLNPNQNMFMTGVPLNMGGGMNMNMMNMNMGNNPGMNFQGNKPQQPPFNPVNLFREQLSSFKVNNKDAKTVFPLKRSAYHVAISYKIYLDKLKKEGRTFDNLDDIDPTKSARRVKTSQKGAGQSAKKKK